MSLTTFTISLDDKIAVIERLIIQAKIGRDAGNALAAERLAILKSIIADLQARKELPRSNALGDLERILDRVKRSKTALGYDSGQLNDLARHVINRWPTISQALELYGEESAE